LEDRGIEGARQYSPTVARNSGPIGNILKISLPVKARVFEIAAGTGEHALHMCGLRNDIIWQPSDPNAESRASQDAWRTECSGQMLASLDIDTTVAPWWRKLTSYDAIFCANMIHIAPWAAAIGFAQGAGHILKSDGQVFLYGPFLEGNATAQSNLDFDRSLKSRNPEWGVRTLDSVKHIFADAGLRFVSKTEMPKENRLLIFKKSS